MCGRKEEENASVNNLDEGSKEKTWAKLIHSEIHKQTSWSEFIIWEIKLYDAESGGKGHKQNFLPIFFILIFLMAKERERRNISVIFLLLWFHNNFLTSIDFPFVATAVRDGGRDLCINRIKYCYYHSFGHPWHRRERVFFLVDVINSKDSF